MRTCFFTVIIATALMCCGCKSVADRSKADGDSIENEVVSGYDSDKVTQGSWLGLFLGMCQVEGEKDKDGYTTYYYDCTVPELEGDDNVLSQELEATWYKDDYTEPAKYSCMLGLYVDKDFPSDEIFRQVEIGIDTLLTQSFYYNDELENLKKNLALRKGYAPKNGQDILDRGKQIFDQFTKRNSQLKTDSASFILRDARVCIVAHKIYDRGDWASYIIEFSFDYNGSCGCPSWADYITVNKKTGRRLSADDLVKKYGYARLCKDLRDDHIKAKRERNSDLELYDCTGQELIGFADGCAIVNEGVMFYYRPYSIGCGADGEFNLVLDYPWP